MRKQTTTRTAIDTMHRPQQRTPFTTTALRSGVYPPAEYARMADEALSLLGHPGEVRLEPTLPDNDSVRCQTAYPHTCDYSFLCFFSDIGSMSLRRALSDRCVFVYSLWRRLRAPSKCLSTLWASPFAMGAVHLPILTARGPQSWRRRRSRLITR